MSDAFWAFMGVVVVQVCAIVLAYINGRKAKTDRQEIMAQVCEVKDHLATASMQKDDIALMIEGAERKGYVGGIQEGKRQATGPAPLGK